MDAMHHSKRVLLVEDNADDEHLTLRGLRKCPVPPHVDVARDGSQAVDFLLKLEDDSERPDLILLDLKLPKLSGIEVLKRIREREETRAIPVVVLTSSDEESDVRRCYEYGANSYVCKPVDYTEFLNVVRGIGTFWLCMAKLPSLISPETTSAASK